MVANSPSPTAGSPVYKTVDSAGTNGTCLLDTISSSLASPSGPGYGDSPKSLDLEDAQCVYRKGSDDLEIPSASFSACSINMLKTIFGFGMLVMPSSFAVLGYVPGLFFIVLTGFLAAFGLHLFVISSQYIGRNATVNKLALMTYPNLTVLFDFAIALKCLGVATSYLMAIAKMGPQIMMGFKVSSGFLQSHDVWLLIAAFVLVPLAFLRRMDSLKYTSFFGLLSVLYVVMLTVWQAFKPGAKRPLPGNEIQLFGDFSLTDIKSSLLALKRFAVFVFSFTCHQNIFPIQKEAIDNSPKFMNRVVNLCLGLSAVAYIVFSMSAYITFGRDTKSDFFSNYSNGVEVTVARLLFLFLGLCSYPLQTLPCRNSLENIIPLSKAIKATYSRAIYMGITSFILMCSFLIAYLCTEIDTALQIVGNFAGIPICYILPFLLYYKLTENHGWTWKRIGAAALAAFGVCAMSLGTLSLLMSQFESGGIFGSKVGTQI